jgi:hypothetical protein
MLRTFKVKLLVSSVPSTPMDSEKILKSEKLMDDNNDRCKVMTIAYIAYKVFKSKMK